MSKKERIKGWTLTHKLVIFLVIIIIGVIAYYTYPPFQTGVQNVWARTQALFGDMGSNIAAHPFIKTYIIGLPWVALWCTTIGLLIGIYIMRADIWFKRRGYQATVDELAGGTYHPQHTGATPPPSPQHTGATPPPSPQQKKQEPAQPQASPPEQAQ